MPGVTVIIPCYNGERFLRPCLESVLQQRYDGPVEVLLGDDGSTDGSAAVAAAFGSAVRILRHPGGVNRGLPATRNLCIRAAAHDLLAFLDADDVWLPGHVAALASALTTNPLAGLAYDNGAYLLPDGREWGSRPPAGHHAVTAERLLLDCCLSPSGVMVRRSVLEAVGLFDESLRYCEDHDLWLRVLERYPAVYVPVRGYLYRQHSAQMTRSPELWRHAAQVLAKARHRRCYPRSALRRRQAVIDYRFGECAAAEGKYLRAVYHFAEAALKDPLRTLCILGAGLNPLR